MIEKASRALTLLTFTLLTALVLAAPSGAAENAAASAFDEVFHHYQSIRATLAADSTDGVAENARSIEKVLEGLEAEWSAENAGVATESADDTRQLLPLLRASAGDLAAAEDLAAARDAFYELSKPLVRWRKAATGEEVPVVAYCSMSKRSWLQAEGEKLGNPYHGQSMLRCGEIVDG